jgi:hypothetical protein
MYLIKAWITFHLIRINLEKELPANALYVMRYFEFSLLYTSHNLSYNVGIILVEKKL